MILSYKSFLKKTFVFNDGICLKNDFTMIYRLSQDLILEK